MDGVRTGEGGMRELQEGWPGLHWGRWEVSGRFSPTFPISTLQGLP